MNDLMPSGTTILIVEDDAPTAQMMAEVLQSRGYRVWHASSGAEAESLAHEVHPDLIIIDLILPDVDGLVLCANLKSFMKQPIVICSGTRRRRDPILSLKLGADDFIAKPFDIYDFEARIEAALRRAARNRAAEPVGQPEYYRVDDLVVDGTRHRVTLGGQTLQLTPTEYRLIAALTSAPDKVFSRQELANLVWGYPDASSGRTIDVHIRRLRGKLEAIQHAPPEIVSVRGFGYKVVPRHRIGGLRALDTEPHQHAS